MEVQIMTAALVFENGKREKFTLSKAKQVPVLYAYENVQKARNAEVLAKAKATTVLGREAQGDWLILVKLPEHEGGEIAWVPKRSLIPALGVGGRPTIDEVKQVYF